MPQQHPHVGKPHGERFRHGLDVYTRMTANAYGGGLNPALAELEADFPFLVDAAMSFAIGDVWGRPQLAPKSRELAMVTALAAVGRDGYPQLRLHAGYALNFGATREELREIVYLTIVIAGVPAALNVAPEIAAIIGPMPVEREQAVVAGSRRARGEAVLASLEGTESVNIGPDPTLGPLIDTFPFLVDATLSLALGDVWSRTVLDPVDRQLAAVAAFAAIGVNAWPQMRRHAAAALTLGASTETVKEILAVTIVSAGLPKALNAALELRPILTGQDKEA